MISTAPVDAPRRFLPLLEIPPIIAYVATDSSLSSMMRQHICALFVMPRFARYPAPLSTHTVSRLCMISADALPMEVASEARLIPNVDSIINVNLDCENSSLVCGDDSLCIDGDLGVYCTCYNRSVTGAEVGTVCLFLCSMHHVIHVPPLAFSSSCTLRCPGTLG